MTFLRFRRLPGKGGIKAGSGDASFIPGVLKWDCYYKEKPFPVQAILQGRALKEKIMTEDMDALNSGRDESRGTATYEEILGKGQSLVYTNVGRSMMPLLRQRRDILIIEPKPPGRLKKYDVPLYKRGRKYILHRIVEVTDTGYVIIGDNNTFYEYDVTDDMILGVLTGFVRNDPAGIEKLMFWKKDRRMQGKRFTTEDKAYRAYVLLWCGCIPVRTRILKFRNRTRHILSRIRRFLKGKR